VSVSTPCELTAFSPVLVQTEPMWLHWHNGVE
jgi:hypothetical protein